MTRALEYREHAAECRKLAAAMTADNDRDQLLGMAGAWERMAREREREVDLTYRRRPWRPRPS